MKISRTESLKEKWGLGAVPRCSLGSCPIAKYAELKRLVEQEGLLAKQPAYYIWNSLFTLALLALSLIFLAAAHDFRLQLLNATFLAFVFCQLSFIVHDAGHRQISEVAEINDLIGLVCTNLLLGLSFSYWRQSHNKHHANANQRDVDPDIDIAVLAFSEEEACNKKGVLRLIAKYQAYFFIPMLLFDSIRRRKEAIEFLLQTEFRPARSEYLLLAAHYALGLAFLFHVLGVSQALVFFLVQQGAYGLFMASIFAPNHKGMPILDKDNQMDFLRRQVLTTRNVKAHPFTDFWYGALNYQIEHHLFPTMPRNKLKQSQEIIRTFCEKNSIKYYETSALESYSEVLKYLHRVGASLRRD